MPRVKIEYHNGSPPVEVDLSKIIQYDVQKGKNPGDPDRIVACSNGRGKCGYEYLTASMIHEYPLVIGTPKEDGFEQIISMRAVKSITKLEDKVEGTS